MPSLTDLQQFLVTGLSLGGVYALSGVGMIVLYRATGVLYLAFGAVGAMGALVAWQLINHAGVGFWPASISMFQRKKRIPGHGLLMIPGFVKACLQST